MGQTVRGGRAALNRINDDLKEIDRFARNANDSLISNTKLAEKCIGNLLMVVEVLQRFVMDELEPVLERRDRAGASDIDDLLARIAALERWRAEQEREEEQERGPIPFRKVKQGSE